jgi:hypothetical protein
MLLKSINSAVLSALQKVSHSIAASAVESNEFGYIFGTPEP